MLRFISVVVVLILFVKGSSSQINVCGGAPLNTRIVGGQDTTSGSWPWQASLQSPEYDGHFCGGSLINNYYVMTAAHCFTGTTTNKVIVYLGKNTLQGSNPYQIARKISKVFRHPQYNSITNDNDILLLRLNASVTFNNYIRPVCLASKTSVFRVGARTWITGWGTVNQGSVDLPNVLQEAEVPIVNRNLCQSLLGYDTVTANMMCAGYLEGGTDTCQGDSGGPLVIKQGTVWVQAGITSWGDGCALPNKPGVYTRVSQYQDWISNTVKPNTCGFVTIQQTT